jgi:hypothetical protein
MAANPDIAKPTAETAPQPTAAHKSLHKVCQCNFLCSLHSKLSAHQFFKVSHDVLAVFLLSVGSISCCDKQ